MIRTCKRCGVEICGDRCKPCNNNRVKKFYQDNIERLRAEKLKWYHLNKEEIAIKNKQKRLLNGRSIAQRKSDKRYRERNKTKHNAYKKEFYSKNKDSIIEKVLKWQNADVENLGDKYVRNQLQKRLGIKNPPQELINLKRKQLQLKRMSYEKQEPTSTRTGSNP